MTNSFLWILMGVMSWLRLIILPIVDILGIIVCSKKSRDNILFKKGIWFFILNLIATVYGYINNFAITPYIINNRNALGFLSSGNNFPPIISILSFPTFVINVIAYIILIRGFYIRHKQIESKDNN
ncbi:hypothetical protein [Brassicibacter mesophilus]|uniref:hypothetical protein n=1 Tax=Brassicibacter mesophilus TaxID=745119 RepID=UPI003D1E478F